ncbi:NudC domain-containing protein 3 [Gryllus bimaculatus]|nr:NudC domain-containing protein 3 [Gryllus bimaculatus]
MAKSKHDEVLLGILKEETHLYPFLDVIFGFLYRCTDFYQIQHHPEEKLGFPPGIAQNIVTKVFKKWEAVAEQDRKFCERQRLCGTSDGAPPAIQEVEISDVTDTSNPAIEPMEVITEKLSLEEIPSAPKEKDAQKQYQSSDTSYNGAIRDGYQWSQSISDLDVQIHLEKQQERWWDALFISEPKIDLQKIDASRPMEDLSQEEQMKIQELMWNQERKRKGLPTSDNMALEKMLREAWDKEGSPFKGRPYNPNEINFGNNTIGIPECEGNT